MQSATALDLAFLAPGLTHQFGNLLLTIQGHALYLDADVVARVKPVLLHTCERGAGTLRILRHLLGGAEPERAEMGPVVLQVAELLRIPVREAGHSLTCPVAPATTPPVELGAFVPLLVAMVRGVCGVVPSGVRGTIELACDPSPPGALSVHFRPGADSLPFPLALHEPLRQLQAQSSRRGWALRVDSAANRLVLGLPAAAAGLEA